LSKIPKIPDAPDTRHAVYADHNASFPFLPIDCYQTRHELESDLKELAVEFSDYLDRIQVFRMGSRYDDDYKVVEARILKVLIRALKCISKAIEPLMQEVEKR